MITERKAAANRENARRSTGPQTPEGKTVSALNACRHGLLARETVLREEDADAFGAFHEGLRLTLAPVGAIQDFLVDRISSCAWRLRRVLKAEAKAFARDDFISTLLDHADDGGEEAPREAAYAAFLHGPMDTLARYEAAIERSLYRALHELHRLQAVRAGQMVPPPVALDVEVSGGAN